jgi:hypothetical protein
VTGTVVFECVVCPAPSTSTTSAPAARAIATPAAVSQGSHGSLSMNRALIAAGLLDRVYRPTLHV